MMDRILAEQREARDAVLAADTPEHRLWLADWVAEEVLMFPKPISVSGQSRNNAREAAASGRETRRSGEGGQER